MKIAIPTSEGRLCSHFGHCESFTFVEINDETKEIIDITNNIPDDGISCQSAGWIAQQGVNVVLAGGMGGRPLMIFAQNNVNVVAGCPELEIKELVDLYLNNKLQTGENACGSSEGHHHCHGHGNNHHCHNH